MIRFVDLRHVEQDIQARFAFWDTVTDSFLTDVHGMQAWHSMADLFGSATLDIRTLKDRLTDLAPAWAFEDQGEKEGDTRKDIHTKMVKALKDLKEGGRFIEGGEGQLALDNALHFVEDICYGSRR